MSQNKKTKQKLPHFTRREALGILGSASLAPLAVDPIKNLIVAMAEGLIQRAQAADVASEPPIYIQILLTGGPHRTAWDQMLCPYAISNGSGWQKAALLPNQCVTTRFDAGTKKAVYSSSIIEKNASVGAEKLAVPTLWDCNMPVWNGSNATSQTAKIHELMNQMLVINCRNPTDGHQLGRDLSHRPNPAAASIHGYFADASAAPFASVGLAGRGTNAFSSKKGFAQTVTDNLSDPLSEIMNVYRDSRITVSAFKARRAALDSMVQGTLRLLKEHTDHSGPGADALYQMRNSAEGLLSRDYTQLSAEFSTLKAKYDSLIKISAQLIDPGVSDFALPSSVFSNGTGSLGKRETRMTDNTLAGQNRYLETADLRTVINRTPGATLSDSATTATIHALASNFAATEYLITRGYTTSAMIGTSQIQNMFFESLSIYSDRNQAAQTNITNGVAGYDAHEDGNAYNLICMSFLFRALSACTHELISSLKRASLWNRSMIHISAEFTRSARSAVNPTDNMGSDHGWSGNTHTLLSGKFDRFASVGNIARGDAGGGYAGTWGSVALTNVDGTSIHPLLGNVASTIAKVMGVETPTPNDPPLGVIQNGQLLLRAEKTKLVA